MAESDQEFVKRMYNAASPASKEDPEWSRLFAIADRGAEIQWRPIETAPKDGTCFLAKQGYAMVTTYWHRDHWAKVDWLDPVEWMPLPPPPKGETNE